MLLAGLHFIVSHANCQITSLTLTIGDTCRVDSSSAGSRESQG